MSADTPKPTALSKIVIETRPHAEQRYPTSGDWGAGYATKPRATYSETGDCLIVTVSEMGDWRIEALVAVHELIEALLCKSDGVSEKAVCDFDVEFEAARDEAVGHREDVTWFGFRGRPVDADAEPGDDPDAPYARQHTFATAVERMLCAALGVKWNDYEVTEAALYGR